MNLPKIKVPLILGIWGGKGQVRTRAAVAQEQAASSPLCKCAGIPFSCNLAPCAGWLMMRCLQAMQLYIKSQLARCHMLHTSSCPAYPCMLLPFAAVNARP
jgi:hypothetical protein